MYRALVVEDHVLMRLALIAETKEVLSECFVIGAGALHSALDGLEATGFDLVSIDPGLPGLEPNCDRDRQMVVELLIEASPGAIHLVITRSDSAAEGWACRGLGAAGHFSKADLTCGALGEVLHDIRPHRDVISLVSSNVDEFLVAHSINVPVHGHRRRGAGAKGYAYEPRGSRDACVLFNRHESPREYQQEAADAA